MTRSPPTCRCWSGLTPRAPSRCCESLMETLVGTGRGPSRLAGALVHPSPARPARLSGPSPARLLLDVPARRAPVLPRRGGDHRHAARDPGALAGLNWDIDRDALAEDLGFERALRELARRGLQPRLRARLPLGGVDLRHAPLAARLGDRALVEPGVRLLRAARLVLRRARASCPRRRTPTPRSCCGARPRASPPSLTSLLGTMHALPLAYSKDLQEDKEPLFDAIDNLELCLAAATGMLGGISFNRERLAAAAGDEMLAATDLADALVQEGVPFREAHGLVGGLVKAAVESGSRSRSWPTRSSTAFPMMRGRPSTAPSSPARPSSRRSRWVAPPPARWPIRSIGRARRSTPCAREPGLLRPLRARGGARADRLRAPGRARPPA